MTVAHCGLWDHDMMMSCRWFLRFGGTHCLILPEGSHFHYENGDSIFLRYAGKQLPVYKADDTVKTFIAV